MRSILLRSMIAALVGGAFGIGGGILYGCVLATGEYVTDDDFFGVPPEVFFMALLVVPPVVVGATVGVGYLACALVRRDSVLAAHLHVLDADELRFRALSEQPTQDCRRGSLRHKDADHV